MNPNHCLLIILTNRLLDRCSIYPLALVLILLMPLVQLLVNPTMEDWNSIKRIFRYLQATRNYCLKYSVENSKIIGYSDASYAPVANDRKSTSGFFFISNGAISWRSKKQPIISLSSMEAKYIALADEIGR